MKAKLLFLCFIWLLAGCGSDPFIGELKYVLKVEQQGQGKIVGEGTYSINQTAVLRAYPDSVNNYTFQGWYFREKFIHNNRILSIQMDENKTVKAVFVNQNQ